MRKEKLANIVIGILIALPFLALLGPTWFVIIGLGCLIGKIDF